MAYINNAMMYLDDETYQMYQDILNQYMEFKLRDEQANNLMMSFAGYGLVLSTDPYTPLEFWLSDKASELTFNYKEIQWRNREIARLTWDIEKVLNNAWLPQTIELFLSDPTNLANTEAILVILLDQIDAWAQDPNVNAINSIPIILSKGFEGLLGSDLSPELIHAGMFLSNLFNTIDPAEETLIQNWLVALSADFATTQTEDPGEVLILQGYLENMINTYFADVMDIPAALGTFLQSMDALKTQELLDQIKLMMILDDLDPSANNARVIIIANIIDILLSDNSFDYVGVVHPIFGIIYDINVLLENPTGGDKALLLGVLDSNYALILNQVPIIALFDLTIIKPELNYIQTFVHAIQTMVNTVSPLVGGQLPPA